MLTDFAYIKES